jgi:lysophospholipase L1-like esterase
MSRQRLIATGAVAALVSGLGGSLLYGAKRLLERQAAIARSIIGTPDGEPPNADRVYRKRYKKRKKIDLLVLGDSLAASLGAELPSDTLGARLAKGAAKRAKRPVRLRTAARVGAEASMLAGQLDSLPAGYRADVAVIVVGGNDVVHRVPVDESVRDLAAAVRRLQDAGTQVVVGTCPDLGAIRPVPQPLRSLGSAASRQMAEAQRKGVLQLGARAVSLHRVTGQYFFDNPDEAFSLDRFHPSGLGYRRTAKAILPSVLAALGVREHVPFGHHAPAAP